MPRCAEAIIRKATGHGVALTTATEAWMSGRGAHYVEMIANAGLVAIHAIASSRLAALRDGKQAVLGTNPIAIAIPDLRSTGWRSTRCGRCREVRS